MIADMAAKKNLVSKKQKITDVGSSRLKQPFDNTRFLGPKQRYRFWEMEKRKIWFERGFEINP